MTEGVFLFFLFARNQSQQLPGLFDSQNGHFGRINKSYLRKKRSLIPIYALMRDFTVFKFHDYNMRQFHFFSGIAPLIKLERIGTARITARIFFKTDLRLNILDEAFIVSSSKVTPFKF